MCTPIKHGIEMVPSDFYLIFYTEWYIWHFVCAFCSNVKTKSKKGKKGGDEDESDLDDDLDGDLDDEEVSLGSMDEEDFGDELEEEGGAFMDPAGEDDDEEGMFMSQYLSFLPKCAIVNFPWLVWNEMTGLWNMVESPINPCLHECRLNSNFLSLSVPELDDGDFAFGGNFKSIFLT